MRNSLNRSTFGVACLLLAGLVSATAGVPSAPAASAIADQASAYDVAVQNPAIKPGAQPVYQADNPGNNLRLFFQGTGVLGIPRVPAGKAWSFDMGLTAFGYGDDVKPAGTPRMSTVGNRVDYEREGITESYLNTAQGIDQTFTVGAPQPDGGSLALNLDIAIGGTVSPKLIEAGDMVGLIAPTGETMMRYGAPRAFDAAGNELATRLEVHADVPAASGAVRIVVATAKASYPITVRASATVPVLQQDVALAAEPGVGTQVIVGTPETGEVGITESVAQIMEREKLAPKRVYEGADESEPRKPRLRPSTPLANPLSLSRSQWPPAEFAPPTLESILSPQTLGTNFKGVGLSEAGFVPPDSMGDVGPTQVMVASNGRIKVFDKAGVLGALNATDATFWSSVRNGVLTTDPEVRYDRLSGRWILMAVNIPAGTGVNNRVMIAVQTTPGTITATSNFTFYFFTVSQGGGTPSDASSFCDYPSLGVDGNALYIGCNMFVYSGPTLVNIWTTGFVVRKSSIVPPPGTLVVTAFRNLIADGTGSGATSGTCGVVGGPANCAAEPCLSAAGPYSPRGVDNDDGTATEGYFFGVDICYYGRLIVRRVSTPGGTPTISGNLAINTPLGTSQAILQPASGSTTAIDSGDDRVYTAAIHKNKISGVSTLWSAQHIEVNAACVATPNPPGPGGGRNGARWYEIGSLTGVPAVVQSGTLCDPAGTDPRGYIYPSITGTGQGHMALGASFASAVEFAGAAVAGRLRSDAPGSTQAATVAQAGAAAYTIVGGGRNRWGDYSFTDVDPNDDMTVWTFQEYADSPANNWSVRATQLRAPPPATPASAAPSSVCAGQAAVSVIVTGNSISGSEFFDPGPDTGGPGYANHIAAASSGGVTVNSVTFTDPTHVTVSLNTTAATPGTKTITVTNPDGQTRAGFSLVTVNASPGPPTASSNGPICAGATLQLSASTVGGATYSWTGPDSFVSSDQNPSIPSATTAASGIYSVTVTVGGCTSSAATTSVTVSPTGGACGDGSSTACNAPDTCDGSGVCQPNIAADGTSCDDADPTTCTDECGGGACAGTFVPEPTEINTSVRIAADKSTIGWTDPSGPYNVYKGSNGSGLPWAYNQTCLDPLQAGSSSSDSSDPALGGFFYYLVSRVDQCRESVIGRNSVLAPDPNTSPCTNQ